MTECKRCHGERWVCENHPQRPWAEDDRVNGCQCGAGDPCPDCNPCDDENPPAMPPRVSDLPTLH